MQALNNAHWQHDNPSGFHLSNAATLSKQRGPLQLLMDKVLITDAGQRAALAITRALGRHGIEVVVGGEVDSDLASKSKYAANTFVYPSPYQDASGFLEALLSAIKEYDINLLIPVTDVTASLILRNRNMFSGVNIPFPSLENYELLTDKIALAAYADEHNILSPKTIIVRSKQDLYDFFKSEFYPVVVKPFKSKVEAGNRWVSLSVTYANSHEELVREAQKLLPYCDVLLQEKIEGSAEGLFVFCQQGAVIQTFSHKRLRELPVTGGVSVYSQGVVVKDDLRAVATGLLGSLKYDGLAMIEFKRSSQNGKPYLIEVNCRPWGSFNLAVQSGVDFAFQLFQFAKGQSVIPVRYRAGKRNRWLKGDLEHLHLVLKSDAPYSKKLKSCFTFFSSFFIPASYDVLSFSDPLPFFTELKDIGARGVRKISFILMRFRYWLTAIVNRKYMKKQIIQRYQQSSSVLFICKGNICRSPFAEFYLKKKLAGNKVVSSCGYLPEFDRASPDDAVSAAKISGVDLGVNFSKSMTLEFEKSNLIFIFDNEHYEYLKKEWPNVLYKTFYLGYLLPEGTILISDPYGKGLDCFVDTYNKIKLAIDTLVSFPEG